MKKAIIGSVTVGIIIGIIISAVLFEFLGMRGWGPMMGGNYDDRQHGMMGDIDRHFIEQMIPHHQMAIMMSAMLLRGTEREEMKTLAEEIIDAQSEEIDKMRSWY